jgi:hypothetical protein
LKEGEEQMDFIFYTRAPINDRSCSLIIDSGSCANVASSKMVNLLKLGVQEHHKPYTLTWLNDLTPIRVKKKL